MASPVGTPSPPGKPSATHGASPTYTTSGAGDASPSSAFPPSSFAAMPPPPPAGVFSYPSAIPHFHYDQQDALQQMNLPSSVSHPLHLPNPNPTLGGIPNAGARLMALLNARSKLETGVSMPLPSSAPSDFSAPPNPTVLHPVPSVPPTAPSMPAPSRLPSSKLPREKLLGGGNRVVYDVDARLPGEKQPPHLAMTPIAKYPSDPTLVLGRQIAVNRAYICYGRKSGDIRVLNINTALRSLLKGHTQRVSDMGFFAEGVHLLASASIDGEVFVWKIGEGLDEKNKPEIIVKIIIAVQFVGNGESCHPHICWHSHKQEILFIGIGNCVLKLDIRKIGRGKEYSAEEPLKCPIEKLIDGVQLIGKHDAEVTDLSISQWVPTRLASASKDGMVKIWDDRRVVALSSLKPHDGHPVNMVAFMISPHCPDHINLITSGPLNREVKIWSSMSQEGWVWPNDNVSLQCTQTLDLRSSLQPQLDEAFFNQIIVLPQASLIIIANARKNRIYAVHIDYGPCPASTRMDFITDFTVEMPILSLTGTNDILPDGEQIVQVYCVQTQAIQQYALDLTQCLPLPTANSGPGIYPMSHIFELPGSEVLDSLEHGSQVPTGHEFLTASALQKIKDVDGYMEGAPAMAGPASYLDIDIRELLSSSVEIEPNVLPLPSIDLNAPDPASSSDPLNMDHTGKISSPRSLRFYDPIGALDVAQTILDSLVDRRVVVTNSPDVPPANESTGKDEHGGGQNDDSIVPNPDLMFKLKDKTTHLVTPEILSGALSSKRSAIRQKMVDGVKVQDVNANNNIVESSEVNPKVVDMPRTSQQAVLGTQKGFELIDADYKEGSCQTSESVELLTSTVEENIEDGSKEIIDKGTVSAIAVASQFPPSGKLKKQKQKQTQASGTSTPVINPFISTDSLNEPGSSNNVPSSDAAFPQIIAMKETLNQLVNMQMDLQKQMNNIVSAPVAKEGKRLETTLDRNMESAMKANVDALWARFQEENVKHEKVENERMQQFATLITNCMNKDMPAMLEKVLKKEISSVGSTVAHAISPLISSAVTESFQRCFGNKAVSQLEKSVISKLDASVSRQIQNHFQTSGKQALQEALRSCLDSTVIPAFEQSCKAMLNQVDNAFQKGMSEHIVASQQHLEATHTPLALTLRDAINSASSITQNVSAELIDGHRKLLALVAAGNSMAIHPVGLQQTKGGIPETHVEAPIDPKMELTRIISEYKHEEAFTMALQRSDVALVSWLCTQVNVHAICSATTLSQGVLLALLQQLSCDIDKETERKVGWMIDVTMAINPMDPTIASHVRPILVQVYNILCNHRALPGTSQLESNQMLIAMHVITSLLSCCK